jgi:hypothetical protein
VEVSVLRGGLGAAVSRKQTYGMLRESMLIVDIVEEVFHSEG